jgi:glyoxylase-like metal-dependent hydrolase (beta-lactamase superfamily II)
VEISTTVLGSGFFMLSGAGGNIGVSVGSDGVFLIDDQFAPLTPKIRSAVAALGEGSIRFVLNTHWHGDHTGGNENLGEAGALIVAHHKVRERMSTPQFMEAFQRRVPASPSAALPVVTFGEEIAFHLNGHTLDVVHVAGAHTDGDSIVHVPSANVLHMGDAYFNGFYPFFDLSTGGSVEGMIAAMKLGLGLSDPETRIIPGHGALSNRSELEASVQMLTTVRDRVANAIAAGQSLDEVVASRPTADLDAEWGDGFLKPDRFVTFVYQSLSAR